MRRINRVLATLVACLVPVVSTGTVAAADQVTHAVFTTVNVAVDGDGTCANGNPEVNCNLYSAKEAVWTSGGPLSASLGDGTYYFAVLDPGGQNDAITDGHVQNLSSVHDAYTDRTFSVVDGHVQYAGPHDVDGDLIRLAPYADTHNPGGVYILAVCSLHDGYPTNPDDCKYDAFKIREGDPAPIELDLTAAIDASTSYTRTFGWSIDKSASPRSQSVPAGSTATVGYHVGVAADGVDGAWTASGSVTASNPNGHDVTVDVSVAVDDGAASCAVSGGTGLVVPASGSASVPWSCTYASAPQSTATATATVGWAAFGSPSTTAGATAPVDFTGDPTTVVDGLAGVTDTQAGPWVAGAPGASFDYSTDFAGDPAGTCTTHGNVATVTGATTGASSSASADVQVCVGADLTTAVTTSPVFTRTYGWSLAKSVDKPLVQQVGGGSTTLGYSVVARQTGFADSAWGTSGTVTITNPNDWESVSATPSVTTTSGGTCAVSPSPVVVPASGSAVATYGCLWASAPAPAVGGAVQASVTWDAIAAATPTGAAAASAALDFVAPTTRVNPVVTVTDTVAGTLGTVAAVDTAPFASRTFTYSRVVAVPANGCITVPNTASIASLGLAASASARVCGPVRTGALTIGYWQNKNGQAVITGGASVNGVCASTLYLRGFAPFQDLAATAKCAAVATYATNIIKSASASGAAMNAMLKAQMLATALDVFFSQPTSNAIGAPVSIGSVAVDLTKVCKNIALCTIYESTSSVFGGATTATVSQLLTYAASQSNVGGTAWYGQVKATQELAKDTFDAINNSVIFGA